MAAKATPSHGQSIFRRSADSRVSSPTARAQTTSLGSPTTSIEEPDNTTPVTLHGVHARVLDERNNYSRSSHLASSKENLQNNQNVHHEQISTTLGEKHVTIIVSAHVNKSVDKANQESVLHTASSVEVAHAQDDGGNTPLNHVTHESCPQAQKSDVATPPSLSVRETVSLLHSHDDTVLESSDDESMTFDGWSYEGSLECDKFSEPTPADGFPEEKSTLVTGHRLPLTKMDEKSEVLSAAYQLNFQPQNFETKFISFPPQFPSEQGPRRESIPLPFPWPA